MRTRGSFISQMLVAFCVFAVLIAVACVAGYVAVAGQNQATKQLTGRYQTLQNAEAQMGKAYGLSHESVLESAITAGGRSDLALQRAAEAQYAAARATLQRLSPPSLRGQVSAQAHIMDQWFALAPQIVAARPGTPGARALIARSGQIAADFNTSIDTLLAQVNGEIQRLRASGKQALQTGLAWITAALGVAVLLLLAGSLSTLSTITRPLRKLTVTVRRLTSGDHAARARLAGSAEVREVAHAVNSQADESDRLRTQEKESNRLRAMARAAGIRIREPLTADAVIAETRAALEQNMAADRVYLHLIKDHRIAPPVGHEDDWALAGMFDPELPEEFAAKLQTLCRGQTSEVVQDTQGADGEHLPARLRAALHTTGVVSQIVTPFGIGDELLGFIVAQRCQPGHHWTAAEIDAVESIAADLGRGLNHARLYEAENRLVEHLRSLDQAKSDFFATVSHELRTPLTSIEGYTEMLADENDGPLTSRQQQMLATIDRNTTRLRNLVDDVFTLAKLESGAFTTVTHSINIAEIVAGAIQAIRPQAAAAKVTLTSRGPDDHLNVDGNADQLDRVMINLLSNSVKYTPANGRIDVSVAAQNGSVAVQVADTGIGIPEADQKNLFTRFFRASNAKAQAIPGTGLGLAIVRTIVASHGGDISVTSAETEGTTITVLLPLRTS